MLSYQAVLEAVVCTVGKMKREEMLSKVFVIKGSKGELNWRERGLEGGRLRFLCR